MTRFKSGQEAEKAMLQGRIESQDSQAILDAYKAEFGVGTLSSSPQNHQTENQCPGLDEPVTHAESQAAPQVRSASQPRHHGQGCTDITPRLRQKKATATAHEAANDVLMNPAVNEVATAGETRLFDDDMPDTAVADDAASRHGHSDEPMTLGDEPRPPSEIDHKPAFARPGRGQGTVKMDVSQEQTPTQVNADRDYAELYEPLPSSPTDGRTQITSNDESRTLNPDDTGAVNFGNLSEFARPSSQVSEDGGFENTRGEWRRPDDTSQMQPNHAFTPYKPQNLAPETPAVPKNPFATKSNGGAVPFGGTQLFGQTQMLSSAVKMASPTSSRPSPNVFLNSISPNILETSPLKNRANVSSPTDIRTSSPLRLHEVPATVVKHVGQGVAAQETPVPLRSQKDDLIPESPTHKTARQSIGHRPMAHYEPMKQSQERKTSGDGLDAHHHPPSHSDSDNTVQQVDRKRRVEKKKAKAAAEMDKVSFIRTQQRLSDEQQQHARKRRKVDKAEADVETVKSNGQGQQPLVRDSQKPITQSAERPSLESTIATPGDAAERGNTPCEPAPELLDDEMIPATSPVRSSPAIYRRDAPSASEPELPTMPRSGTEQRREDLDSSSLPPPARRRSQRTYGRQGRATRARLGVVSSAAEEAVLDQAPIEEAMESSEDTAKPANAPPSSYSEPPIPMGARLGRGEQRTRTPRRSMLGTSSSLTNLSGTPMASSKTTPATQDSRMSDRSESASLASTGDGARQTRRRPHPVAKSESPQPLTKASRFSRRSLRMDSDSTDELPCSPSATALDRSTLSRRSVRPSLASTLRARRLFDGMVFALSFLDNETQRTKLETKITRAGGTILHEGFQELFEPSVCQGDGEPQLRLTRAGLDHGFAAVIADSHSRKPKYLQALALGLPCLAPQWALACLKKDEIVDWAPYLLCAGASSVLGDAIRSRTLLPFSALDAKLSDMVDARDKLLHERRLLVVTDHKKWAKETQRQVLFLALALGPSVAFRVASVGQAGEAVLHAEQTGSPYEWIYVDSRTGDAAEVLAAAQFAGKKRRKSGGEPVGQGLRVMTNELIIQSLILGRMVELDEMKHISVADRTHV